MGDAVTLVVAGIFGSMLGSFLNVVIYRLPRRESLVLPGSRCPSCETPIRWFDNIPVLSWLALRGRCRACKAAISPRYLFIEALTAALSVLVAARFLTGGADADWARFVAVECLVLALVAVTFIDLDHRIIPDKITKPGMVLALLFSIVAPGLHQIHWLGDDTSPAMAGLILSVAGLVVGGVTILLMGIAGKAVFKKDAMGFGDVKFMAMVGGFVGPVGVLLVILIACIAGSVVGVLSWLVTRSHYIPFGPFLSLGTALVLFYRADIVHFITVTYPSLFR